MIVTLNGRRLAGAFAAEPTLQTLLDAVRAAHLTNEVVVSVAVNGRGLAGQELVDRLAQPVAAGDQVDLESAEPRALAADALRDAAGQLAAVGQVQAEIADQLNAGQVAEALGRVQQLVGAWQTSRQTVAQCCDLLGRDLTACEYRQRPVQQHLDELADRLRELRDALQAQDMVLLADLLHYEMPPLCASWHDLLKHLAEALGAPSPAALRQR